MGGRPASSRSLQGQAAGAGRPLWCTTSATPSPGSPSPSDGSAGPSMLQDKAAQGPARSWRPGVHRSPATTRRSAMDEQLVGAMPAHARRPAQGHPAHRRRHQPLHRPADSSRRPSRLTPAVAEPSLSPWQQPRLRRAVRRSHSRARSELVPRWMDRRWAPFQTQPKTSQLSRPSPASSRPAQGQGPAPGAARPAARHDAVVGSGLDRPRTRHQQALRPPGEHVRQEARRHATCTSMGPSSSPARTSGTCITCSSRATGAGRPGSPTNS